MSTHVLLLKEQLFVGLHGPKFETLSLPIDLRYVGISNSSYTLAVGWDPELSHLLSSFEACRLLFQVSK